MLLSDRGRQLVPFILEHGVSEIVCCSLDAAIEIIVDEVSDIETFPYPSTVEFVYADSRAFLCQLPVEKKYDLILVDQPDPVTVLLNRLYTYE